MYANRKTMAPGVKQNFDEKVQEDFLFYLEYFKEAFDGLKSDCDKEICKVITSLRIVYILPTFFRTNFTILLIAAYSRRKGKGIIFPTNVLFSKILEVLRLSFKILEILVKMSNFICCQ